MSEQPRVWKTGDPEPDEPGLTVRHPDGTTSTQVRLGEWHISTADGYGNGGGWSVTLLCATPATEVTGELGRAYAEILKLKRRIAAARIEITAEWSPLRRSRPALFDTRSDHDDRLRAIVAALEGKFSD